MKQFIFLFTLGLMACSEARKKGPSDSPTQGKIHIAVDEAFAPVIASEINAFHGMYPKAQIVPHYVTEDRAFELLMADSVRLVISSRDFSLKEKEYFKSLTIKPSSLKIATDAIGLVIHTQNPDSLLKMSEFRNILTETEKRTAALLVMDKEGSSNERSLLEKLGLRKEEIKIKTVYAGGDREVINYVNAHPETIGCMGVNWISDQEDPLQMRFKSGIKVVALMPDSIEKLQESEPGLHDEEYFQPMQAYLAQGFYPLIRNMMVCSREARSGLGTGFIAWLSSDKGQRVVLKAGLLPATMPIRVVKIKKDNDLSN
jgi:phosphate transport system substrate-binding protein